MAKSKKKVAAKPVKKSAAPKKKPAAKKVSKPAPKKAKPASRNSKPASSKSNAAAKPKAKVKAIPKKAGKAAPKKAEKKVKDVAKAKSKGGGAIAKKIFQKLTSIIKPHAKLEPKVQGKDVVKPIVKLSIQPIKKKEPELRTRYSDDELEEFRKLIVDKLDAAKKELKYLQDQINRKGDNGTDDTENKFASADDGSSSMEREYLNQMAARQIMYMDHLDKALVRIQNKTYGICRVTGKLIEKERLKSVPHATLSMEAKLMQSH